MTYRYFGIVFLCFLAEAVIGLSAQEFTFRSDVITRNQGLSNNSVSCIAKDHAGFLWFGTLNGLNRYDGYDLVTFFHNPGDSASLSHNRINALIQDEQQLLWIGTDDGLNCYDSQTGKFRRYFSRSGSSASFSTDQINGLVTDTHGMLWLATQENGLNSFHKNTGQFTSYPNPDGGKSNNVFCVLADNQNPDYLWCGTAEGLYLFNKSTARYLTIQSPEKSPAISVQTLWQDTKGIIYLGTWGSGLMKFDRKERYVQPCFTLAGTEAFRKEVIRSIISDINGNLILSVSDQGLVTYNPDNQSLRKWNSQESLPDLQDKVVLCLFADPSGIVWIGTHFDGVIKRVPVIRNFKHYGSTGVLSQIRKSGGVTAILADTKGYLWLGTRFGGLYRIDRKNDGVTVYRHEPGTRGLSSSRIRALAEQQENGRQTIWVGTSDGGLNRLDPETGNCTVYQRKRNTLDKSGNNSVSAIIPFDSHHLMLGTQGKNLGEGLDIFHIETGKFFTLSHIPDDPQSLSSNNILVLYKDSSDTLWVGTRNGGLNKFVIRNIDADRAAEVGYFVRYRHDPANPNTLNDNTVYAIHEDAERMLWVATSTGGLNRFDRGSGKFRAYSGHHVMGGNIIYDILGDGNHNLWLSTSKGIMVFNALSEEVRSFDEYDGLQDNGFRYGSSFRSSTGELFFGGIQGCDYFHPDSVRIDIRVPEIAITALVFSGEKGSADVSVLTGKSVLAAKKVEVPFDLNNFSVSFSAMDYQIHARNRFKYKLNGYDPDWIETDASRRYVNYTNLPPGRYVFTVIGSNSDDIWNHQGKSISIVIKPPWWRSTIFIIAVILLIIMGITWLVYLTFDKYRKGRMEIEQKAMETLQDERWQLLTLIDSMPDLIFIKDRESRFTVANKRVAAIMGTTPDKLIGKTDFDFYTPDLAQGFFEMEQEIMGSGNPLINYEEPALDEQGNRIIISTTKVPYRNQNGEIIGLVGICRDITRLKRIEIQLRKKSEDLQETNRLLEERQEEILFQSEELAEQAQHLRIVNTELERLNRTKDKFFSIIAHDLRNPFNAIIGFSELLRNDFYEIDNQQKLNLLELINVSSETAYNLLENLLQWARTQTDKIKYNPEDFNLHDAVQQVINLHGIIAQKKSVVINNHIPPETLVHADKNMVNTILRNLISNAIKFSRPDGGIEVSAKHTADCVEVSVRDTGVGMSHESLGKLFRIDTYHSTSGTMGETGTGLGLIICKEFVEKNNGRIKASSQEGSGTTLTFTLNAAQVN